MFASNRIRSVDYISTREMDYSETNTNTKEKKENEQKITANQSIGNASG